MAVALGAAGFATFAPIYAPQPLLPQLGGSFGVPPAQASLVISTTTAAVAAMTIVAGSLVDTVGRRRLMVGSMAGAGLLGVLASIAPSFAVVLLIRALEGLAVAAIPVSAIALIHVEIAPAHAGFANGLYIGGTALGGMLGRLIAAVTSDLAGWRAGLFLVAGLSLLATLLFVLTLPPSLQPRPPRLPFRRRLLSLRRHATERGLLLLYAIGGLSIASFVGFSNTLPYRLVGAPYHLSATLVGFAFTVYAVGIVASPVAGRLVDRLGRQRVLPGAIAVSLAGLLLASAVALPLTALGFLLVSSGFFAANSVVTGWVARRAAGAVPQATSLYYTVFYIGSSLSGPAAGAAWSWGGWQVVVLVCVGCTGAALLMATTLGRGPDGHRATAEGDGTRLSAPNPI
jgi:YNFM family putative membrane transporter